VGWSKGDIVMGSLKALPDPTSALMNLTVVRGTVCRMEYLRLSGDECEGMPENQIFRCGVQSNPESADLYGFDVMIRGNDDWLRPVGLLRGSSRCFLCRRRIRVERSLAVLRRSLGHFSCRSFLHRHWWFSGLHSGRSRGAGSRRWGRAGGGGRP